MESEKEISIQQMFKFKFNRRNNYDNGIKKLVNLSSWARPIKELIRRIESLHNNQEFSVRDLKSFKKIVKPQIKTGTIDYESLLFEFPGKTLETIKNTINKLYGTKLFKVRERQKKIIERINKSSTTNL